MTDDDGVKVEDDEGIAVNERDVSDVLDGRIVVVGSAAAAGTYEDVVVAAAADRGIAVADIADAAGAAYAKGVGIDSVVRVHAALDHSHSQQQPYSSSDYENAAVVVDMQHTSSQLLLSGRGDIVDGAAAPSLARLLQMSKLMRERRVMRVLLYCRMEDVELRIHYYLDCCCCCDAASAEARASAKSKSSLACCSHSHCLHPQHCYLHYLLPVV